MTMTNDSYTGYCVCICRNSHSDEKKTTESLEDMMDEGKEIRTERNKEANNRNVNGKEIRTHTYTHSTK